jgi:predicted metal-dependent phosphoesterase TrpH
MLILADLHTHAIGDGTFGPSAHDLVAAHLEAALEAGLDCIAVTDHDDLRPGLIAVEYAARQNLPLLVIPGMEITTDQGHLVALGIEEPIAAHQELGVTIATIRERGGVSILPHPFYIELRERTDVDAMERFNARYGDWQVPDNDHFAVVANSDAHSPSDLLANPFRIRIEAEAHTWESVANAIRERQVSILDRRE